MYEVDTLFLKTGGKIRIIKDENPINPREKSNIGNMISFNKDYEVGDRHDYITRINFLYKLLENTVGENVKTIFDRMVKRSETDLEIEDSILEIVKEKYVILPLYLYFENLFSIKSLSLKTFLHKNFDSEMIGWIYAEKVKELTEEQLEELLIEEVTIYTYYLEGNVFGFILEDKTGKEIDSRWGFYGWEIKKNGMLKYLGEDLFERILPITY